MAIEISEGGRKTFIGHRNMVIKRLPHSHGEIFFVDTKYGNKDLSIVIGKDLRKLTYTVRIQHGDYKTVHKGLKTLKNIELPGARATLAIYENILRQHAVEDQLPREWRGIEIEKIVEEEFRKLEELKRAEEVFKQLEREKSLINILKKTVYRVFKR